jgi:hypothetical protein
MVLGGRIGQTNKPELASDLKQIGVFDWLESVQEGARDNDAPHSANVLDGLKYVAAALAEGRSASLQLQHFELRGISKSDEAMRLVEHLPLTDIDTNEVAAALSEGRSEGIAMATFHLRTT